MNSTSFNLVPLLCGSEGTLGIVVGARLRLTPIPKYKRLLVLRYARFDDALSSAIRLVHANPSAIETIDENILQLVRSDTLWHSLRHLLTDDGNTRAINLVEFVGDDDRELETKLQNLIHQLPSTATSTSAPIGYLDVQSPVDRAALWEMRKKGVGLLGKMKGNRRPVPFVEDTAVPPARLAPYVQEFRALLEAEGLKYGMYGHVDVGCLHVRPALDLRDPDDALRLRRVSNQVAALAKRYGGILWGEHGTGFRSEYTPEYFGPSLFAAFCRIKEAFDPAGKLNRGKVALVPNRGHALVSVDTNLRGTQDRAIASTAQQHFSEAIFCNGNGQCFSTDPKVVMCPSSKITRDRIHSPKGRANLIRYWLRQLGAQADTVVHGLAHQQYPSDFTPNALLERWSRSRERESRDDFSHEVYDGLDGCLSCKACATQCPIEVNIPRMKAEFLTVYHERYSRPLSDFLLAGLEPLLKTVGHFPRLLNTILHGRFFSWFLSRVAGLVDLPRLGPTPLRDGFYHEEEYEVVLQCVALFVLFRRPAKEPRLRWWFVAGALGAGAFLLKPTGVGLWVALLAAVLVICARSGAWGTWLPRLAAVAGGAALVGACCFAYLSAMGALHSFIADYVSFNLMYSGQNGMADRLASAWYGAGQVGHLVVVAVVVAWLLTLRGVVRRSGQSDGADGLALLCVIWLPVEVVLAVTSGYSRLQYYFLWLLPATMLLGCALARLSRSDVDEHPTRGARPDRLRLGRLRSSWPAALLAALAFAGLLAPTATLAHELGGGIVHHSRYTAQRPQAEQIAAYVDRHTAPDDKVLVWGGYDAAVNFLAKRRSPTRYPMQLALYYPEYAVTGVPEFLRELKADPPALILDTSPSYGPQWGTAVPPLAATDPWSSSPPAVRAAWASVTTYIHARYRLAGTLGFAPQWPVYVRR